MDTFDRQAFRYCINNPSAWECYDEAKSELMRAADNEIERLEKRLSAIAEVIRRRKEFGDRPALATIEFILDADNREARNREQAAICGV
jgi:hypothetical protein